jgi:hypothetical protein
MPINMHHCRFENTLRALYECIESFSDVDAHRLSETELEARNELIDLCQRVYANYDKVEL